MNLCCKKDELLKIVIKAVMGLFESLYDDLTLLDDLFKRIN